MKKQRFVTVRPSLAAMLHKAGYTSTTEPSVFDATRTAWVFDPDERLLEIVERFYADRDLPLPGIIGKIREELKKAGASK